MGKRLIICILMFSAMVILAGCSQSTNALSDADRENVIRIGYQKNGPLMILKSLGTLDEHLEKKGYAVEWKEFQAGPLLVEALNAGSIDFGRTGNAPVIFAQAADAPFVYIAAGYSKYKGSGIVVSKDSNIVGLEGLAGKTVGFAKGSSSHYLIARALQKVDLSFDDITPAYLNPGDARVAFEQGTIDAMVVWDPYVASTELHSNGKLLVDGEGLTTDRDFFVATKDFHMKHRDVIDMVLKEIEASSKWANENHAELIEMLAPILNIDKESIHMSVERRVYGVEKITEEMIHEQQEIADMFHELKMIPKAIEVKDAVE